MDSAHTTNKRRLQRRESLAALTAKAVVDSEKVNADACTDGNAGDSAGIDPKTEEVERRMSRVHRGSLTDLYGARPHKAIYSSHRDLLGEFKEAVGLKQKVRMADDYGSRSAVQSGVAQKFVEVLDTYSPQLPAGEEALAVLDCGASTGPQSCSLCRALVRCVGRDREIHWMFNDTPLNAWGECFETASRELDAIPSVAFSAVGKSMYDRLANRNSLSLVLSSTALHWHGDDEITWPADHCITWTIEDEALRAPAEQGLLRQWRFFLTHRGAELRSGGLLMVSIPTRLSKSDLALDLMRDLDMAMRECDSYLLPSGARAAPVRLGCTMVSLEQRIATITEDPDLAKMYSVVHTEEGVAPETPWYKAYLEKVADIEREETTEEDKRGAREEAGRAFTDASIRNGIFSFSRPQLVDALSAWEDSEAKFEEFTKDYVNLATKTFLAHPRDLTYNYCVIVLRRA